MTTLSLGGRVVAVVGASGTIGAAIVAAFQDAGAVVSGFDLSVAPGVEVVDITDENSLRAGLSGVSGLTDVVNAAGVVCVGPLSDTPTADIERVLRVNLFGSFLVGRVAAGLLRAGGSITFLASQAGMRAAPDWSVYSASKAGVVSLTQALAGELGPLGIRVNALCPGTVEGTMTDAVVERLARRSGTSSASVLQTYASRVPLRRLATPADVANSCLFLASALAAYVTGAVLAVDGGEPPG